MVSISSNLAKYLEEFIDFGNAFDEVGGGYEEYDFMISESESYFRSFSTLRTEVFFRKIQEMYFPPEN
jgi:hypothetical protein